MKDLDFPNILKENEQFNKGLFCRVCGGFIGFDEKETPIPEKLICIKCIISTKKFWNKEWKIKNYIIDYEKLYSSKNKKEFLTEEYLRTTKLIIEKRSE